MGRDREADNLAGNWIGKQDPTTGKFDQAEPEVQKALDGELAS